MPDVHIKHTNIEHKTDALPDVNLLDADRRDRIVDTIVMKCERLIARVKSKRDAVLKSMYNKFKAEPTADAKAVKVKLDAENEKIEKARKVHDDAAKKAADERDAADKASAKVLEDVRKEADKMVSDAVKVRDEAVKKSKEAYDKAFAKSVETRDAIVEPACDKADELKEKLLETGFTVDSSVRTGMRPIRRSKGENVLGGPLAEEVKAEASAKIEKLQDMIDETATAVEIGGTALAAKLESITARVDAVNAEPKAEKAAAKKA